MLLVSNRESVNLGEPSGLAVLETLLATLLVWGVAWYWDYYWHLWFSVVLTPLFLLRSPESVDKSRRWFAAYLADKTKITPRHTPLRFWVIFLPIILGVTVISAHVLTENFLVGHSGWMLYGRALLVGIVSVWIVVALAVAGSVAGSVVLALVIAFLLSLALAVADVAALAIALAFTVTLAGSAAVAVVAAVLGAAASGGDLVVALLLAGIPWMTGIWMRSLVIRIVATLCHPWRGLWAMPVNGQRIFLAIDVNHSPELIPGPESLASGFSPRTVRNLIQARGLLKRVMAMALFAAFLMPSLLYRWAIKSSAWFYWPLLFLHAESGRVDRIILYDSRLERVRQWLALWAFCMMLSMPVGMYYGWDFSSVFPVMAKLYRITFDLRLWSPWQWCVGIGILLTVIIPLYGSTLYHFLNHSPEQKSALPLSAFSIQVLLGLVQIRSVSMVIFLLLSGGYTGFILMDVSTQQNGGWLASVFSFYGRYLPKQ